MVRRTTAREKVWARRQVCGNVFGLRVEIISPGYDEFRCVPVLTSRSVVGETIIGIRLKARRCDCSFVFAVPVQTSVGKFKSVDVVPLLTLSVRPLRRSVMVCSLVRSTVRPMRCVPACSPWQPRRRFWGLWHPVDPARARWALDLA